LHFSKIQRNAGGGCNAQRLQWPILRPTNRKHMFASVAAEKVFTEGNISASGSL
jgi:hypothetical protein